MSYFILGGITVPVECFAEFDQSYEPLERTSIRRMSDGTGRKQTAWDGKLIVKTSGSGWAPLGLSGLDYQNPLLFSCADPRSITAASNIITIPAERRTDAGYTPIGFAIVNNELVETSLSLATNTATLGIVSGATAYRVHYWPEITVLVKQPLENWNKSGNAHGWSFDAEQE